MEPWMLGLHKTIDMMIKERMKELKYNYCLEGIILSVDSNIYTVGINGQEILCKSANDTVYQVDDIVYILIINNDTSNKIILCKR